MRNKVPSSDTSPYIIVDGKVAQRTAAGEGDMAEHQHQRPHSRPFPLAPPVLLDGVVVGVLAEGLQHGINGAGPRHVDLVGRLRGNVAQRRAGRLHHLGRAHVVADSGHDSVGAAVTHNGEFLGWGGEGEETPVMSCNNTHVVIVDGQVKEKCAALRMMG